MGCEDSKTSKDRSVLLPDLLSRRSEVQEELRNIEKRVYDMETTYLLDPDQCGNVLKGYGRFLSASKSCTFLKRSKKVKPQDRLFSLSSLSSPAAKELGISRDARSNSDPDGSQRSNIRKPKRGRTASREEQRSRHTRKQNDDDDDDDDEDDDDDDDDPDLTL